MLAWLHRLASPKRFHGLAGFFITWCGWGALVLFAAGLYYALFHSPPDYQQGESIRIMYIHVPAAWNSMFIYITMAISSLFVLVWRIKAAAAVARACAPLGAMFTFLALATGSLWGKPMWGAWWVWDARLTSELILLFLYLGFMALQSAIEDKDAAARAAGVLAIVGIINIPIIYYSVEWWNTLHQGATITLSQKPKMNMDMFISLILMSFAFKFYFVAAVLRKARNEMLGREQNSQWVKEMLGGSDERK